MNFVRGRTEGAGFVVGSQTLHLPSPAPRSGELVMGIRPEHVVIGAAGGAATGWPMQVQALEMLGAERLVYGLVGDTLFTARLDATLPYPKVGDTVGITASPTQIHWFDAATTMRVGS